MIPAISPLVFKLLSHPQEVRNVFAKTPASALHRSFFSGRSEEGNRSRPQVLQNCSRGSFGPEGGSIHFSRFQTARGLNFQKKIRTQSKSSKLLPLYHIEVFTKALARQNMRSSFQIRETRFLCRTRFEKSCAIQIPQLWVHHSMCCVRLKSICGPRVSERKTTIEHGRFVR